MLTSFQHEKVLLSYNTCSESDWHKVRTFEQPITLMYAPRRASLHRVVSGSVRLHIIEKQTPLQLFFLLATDRSLIVYISAPHKVEEWKRLIEELEHESLL